MNENLYILIDQNTKDGVVDVEQLAEDIVETCILLAKRADKTKTVFAWYAIDQYFMDNDLDNNSSCPLCGEDGGTRCGMPDCEY